MEMYHPEILNPHNFVAPNEYTNGEGREASEVRERRKKEREKEKSHQEPAFSLIL